MQNKQNPEELITLKNLIKQYKCTDTKIEGRIEVNETIMFDYAALLREYEKLILERDELKENLDTFFNAAKSFGGF